MAHSYTIEQIEQLLQEAGQDEPSAAELKRYKRLFKHVKQSELSTLASISQWLQAQLIWDSRDEPLLQGMRSAAQDGYRLRYQAGIATIELAVENEGRIRHIEGEIYAEADDDTDLLLDAGPAFITLLHHGEIIAETTSDIDGRFGFSDLQTADYGMTLSIGDSSRIQLVAVNVS